VATTTAGALPQQNLTNQSSSSSGAGGGVDSSQLSFTQQLQQCSQMTAAADSGILSSREPSRGPTGSVPKSAAPHWHHSGCRGASSDEVKQYVSSCFIEK